MIITKIILCLLIGFSSLVYSKDKIEIPIIKNVNGLIIINLNIEGSDEKFLVDSGSNANFLDPSFISKYKDKAWLRLQTKNKTKVNTFNEKKKSRAFLVDLQIEDLKFKDMESYEINTKRFSKKLDEIECCSGILGTSFLKQMPMQFDLKNKKITMGKGIVAPKSWTKLKSQIIGKDILTVDCISDNYGKLKLRLDSGAEAPLILQPGFIEKHQLREKLVVKGEYRGRSFVDMGEISCGQNKKLASTGILINYPKIKSGALDHRFVDGNLGARILGDKYYLDFSKNIVQIAPDATFMKDIFSSLKQDISKVDLSSESQIYGHAKLKQANVLILNSCLENTKGLKKKCFINQCDIEGRERCNVEALTDDLIGAIHFVTNEVSVPGCGLAEYYTELASAPLAKSFCWWHGSKRGNLFSTKKNHRNHFLPKRSKIAGDSLIEFEVVSSPMDFTRRFYCYSVHNMLITMDNISPELFGFSVKGVSVSRDGLENYRSWLSKSDGLKCLNELKDKLGVQASKDLFEGIDSSKKYIQSINPFTALGDGADNFKENLSEISNHERLHILYSMEDKYKKLARDRWEALSRDEKDKFKKAHPSYNFKNKETLYKEYFSYTFQNNLDDLLN